MRLRHRMIADDDDARPVLEHNCLRQLLSCTYCLDRKETSYKLTIALHCKQITLFNFFTCNKNFSSTIVIPLNFNWSRIAGALYSLHFIVKFFKTPCVNYNKS